MTRSGKSSSENCATIFVSGDPPRSVAFELERLGRGWFDLERETPSSRCFVVLNYIREARKAAGQLKVSILPTMDICCRKSTALDTISAHARERFNLTDPLQRLGLLSRIGVLLPRSATTTSRRNAIACRSTTEKATPAPPQFVAKSIRSVQECFDLHVSVRDLSHRLGVATSTLDRWCSREGSTSPKSVLCGGLMEALIREMRCSAEPLYALASRLGFSSGANLSRFVQRAFCCTFRELRGRV